MKKISFNNRSFALLILLTGMTLSAQAQVLNWQYTNVLTDIQQSGARPDLYVAANGDMYLSFWNPEVDQLFFARRIKASGQWSLELVDQLKPGGYASAITVDATGAAHIAYMENSLSTAYLRYATNASGAWVTEDVLPGRSLGKYGPGNIYPVFAQLSVDITLNTNGLPVIAFFDGDVFDYNLCADPPYNMYSDYDLNLNIVSGLPGGGWDTTSILNVPYEAGGCLAQGDRHGEFCHFLPGVGDSLRVITNSLHNHQLVMFSAANSNLNNWTMQVLDSTQRFQTVSNSGNNHQWYEGFEYIDGLAASDSTFQLVYGLSELYGNGTTTLPRRRALMYAHVQPDSLGTAGYSPRYVDLTPPQAPPINVRDGDYRPMISLASKDSNLFVSYLNFTKNQLIMQESHDRGFSWTKDTLQTFFTNSRLKSTVYGDTLFLFSYDSKKNYLQLSTRSVQGGTWQHRPATIQENRGESLSSQVIRNGSTDLIHIAYNETFRDEFFFTEGTPGGSWTTTPVNEPGKQVKNISLGTTASGNPCMAYSVENPDRLRFAYRNVGTWAFSNVDNTAIPRDIAMKVYGDSVHICYFDLSIGGLRYARGAVGSNTWVRQVLDSSSVVTGRYPSMAVGDNGDLHISYVDVTGTQLKYAHRSATGVWTLTAVTQPFEYAPAQNSLQLTSDNLPHIAFRDAADNAVVYAALDNNGLWTSTQVISDATNLMAIPIKLVLDANDRPWIVYNYSAVLDELRLLRRDAQGNWNAVSVNNNAAEIANSFDFHLTDRDFYLIGKKNAFQNNGVGILYASNGVATDLGPRITETSLALRLFPNPVADQLNLEFTLATAAETTVNLYDLMGNQVGNGPASQQLAAGAHRIEIATGKLAAGLYLCRISVGDQVFTKKVRVSR